MPTRRPGTTGDHAACACVPLRSCCSGLAKFAEHYMTSVANVRLLPPGSGGAPGGSASPWGGPQRSRCGSSDSFGCAPGRGSSINSLVGPQIMHARTDPTRRGRRRGKYSEPKAAAGVASWSAGDPELFPLRFGPNYRRNRRKDFPGPALYECVGMDVLEAPTQVRSAISRLMGKMQVPEPATAGPLPQVLVVNFQLPFQTGPVIGEHPAEDHGSSVLLFFRIEPATAAEARDLERASPAVRLFAKYLEEGHPKAEGTHVSGCFKAVGFLENADDLSMPAVLRPIVQRFNGKPVLVEKESRRYGGAGSALPDVVEIAIDVRGFNYVARSFLFCLREQLRSASVQVGLLVQGCRNSELPERLLGAVSFQNLDIMGGRHVELTTTGPACDPGKDEVDGRGGEPRLTAGALALLNRLTSGLSCPRRQPTGDSFFAARSELEEDDDDRHSFYSAWSCSAGCPTNSR